MLRAEGIDPKSRSRPIWNAASRKSGEESASKSIAPKVIGNHRTNHLISNNIHENRSRFPKLAASPFITNFHPRHPLQGFIHSIFLPSRTARRLPFSAIGNSARFRHTADQDLNGRMIAGGVQMDWPDDPDSTGDRLWSPDRAKDPNFVSHNAGEDSARMEGGRVCERGFTILSDSPLQISESVILVFESGVLSFTKRAMPQSRWSRIVHPIRQF
jgi:hypothetical protein